MTCHVIEDDPGVSDSLVLLLTLMGIAVFSYPDAETFIERGRPAAGDTVIVDLVLPGASGADLITWLADRPAPPRIVAISGQSQRAIEEQVGRLPIADVVRKPLGAEALAALIG